MFALIFWLFLVAAFLVVAINGRAPERLFLAFVLAATLATFALNSIYGITAALDKIMLVDAALLLVACAYVALIDRFWPIWFAGFQLTTVATELAKIIFPDAVPGVYESAAGLWGLLALGSMAFAVTLDHRLKPPTRRGAAA